MNYRVEQKYIITADQLAFLRYQLEQVMDYDAYAAEGMYTIRSLYFDDLYDSCFQANEAGEDFREKYRIRTYNNEKKVIHLEIKAKEYGYTKKVKTRLSLQECSRLIEGKQLDWKEEDDFVKKKFCATRLLRRLQPVQIVEYERIPFTDSRGNVRITLDCNISGSRETKAFWEDILPAVPILSEGQHILEVKYDEFLPLHLKKILNQINLQKTAFSKYYYARLSPLQ
ncbi:MAG: polyphosphate polymerase domain-containing protein [Lachnospiraceae bacterium]|nr:polyphosphate polymerase domain-containing protein [Lachnospiraceae bacterium]